MKTPSQKAFIITLTLYTLISLVGYWLYTLDTPPAKENKIKLTAVPVTLAMFQAPPIVAPTPPIQTEATVVEPEIKPEIEPLIEPLPEPKIKPTIEPKIKPKPVQTPPPKIIKPQTIQPVEPKKLPPPPKELPKELPKEQPKTSPVKQKPIQPQPNITAKSVTPATPTPPQLSHPNTEQAEQLYLNELNAQIARHAKNSYPKRAKRRRWEGEVLIQFTLFPNGAIKHLNIIQSSGRSMLDEAAIHILKTDMNSQFKPFPDDIVRNKWIIKVPVNYHLEY